MALVIDRWLQNETRKFHLEINAGLKVIRKLSIAVQYLIPF